MVAIHAIAFLAYAHDLRYGRATQRLKGDEWKLSHKDSDLIPVPQAALISHEIQNHLENLAPSFDGYRLLQKQLKLYRQLASNREWPAFDKSNDLETAEPDQLEPLRMLLGKTGDLTEGMKLFDAIARFQWLHGLNADGVVKE